MASGKLITYKNFSSKHVDPRNVDVWLPECYNDQEKYAVLYMHDGQMLFNASHAWNKQSWNLDTIAGKLIEEGKARKFIVVGIWSIERKRYVEYFPQKPFESIAQSEREAIIAELQKSNIAKAFKPVSDNYLSFLVSELKPFIDKSFSTAPDQTNTFIAGSSMGGLVSMYGICQYPNVFGGTACISTHWPGIFSLENNPIPYAFFNYLNTYLPDPKTHKIYFDCGDQTLDAMYPLLQQKVDSIMLAKGYETKNWLTKYFPGDDHSEIAWSKRVDIPLLFLLGK